jgi:hypothetical protein
MEFPRVIVALSNVFDSLIARNPRSIDHLRQMVEQRILFQEPLQDGKQ